MSAHEFVKTVPDAPPGFFQAEADGLRWLAEPGAVPVVRVIRVDDSALVLERLTETDAPTPQVAREFGRRLAALHAAGAPGFGWVPSERAWFGPLSDPLDVQAVPRDSFTEFWVTDRLRPMAERAAPLLDVRAREAVAAAIDAVATGVFAEIAGQSEEAPARVHGDLWAGNVMWTERGGTLIDPSAHGGHPLEDLALLALFGAPQLREIFAGYAAARAEQGRDLPSGWEADLPAHQLYCLLAHVVLFGTGYAAQTVAAARAVTARGRALAAAR